MANHRQPTKREHALIDVMKNQHMLMIHKDDFNFRMKSLEKEVKAHYGTPRSAVSCITELDAEKTRVRVIKDRYRSKRP